MPPAGTRSGPGSRPSRADVQARAPGAAGRRMEEAQQQPDERALAAPLGPRNPNTSPSPTSSVTSSSAAIASRRGRGRRRSAWSAPRSRSRGPRCGVRHRRKASAGTAARFRYDRPDALPRRPLAPRHRRLHVVGQDRRAAAPAPPRRDRQAPDPARPPRRRRPDARRVRREPVARRATRRSLVPKGEPVGDPVARARARRRPRRDRGGAVLRRRPADVVETLAPERPPRHRERPQHRLRGPAVRPDARAARARRRDHDAQRDLRRVRRDRDPDPAPGRRAAGGDRRPADRHRRVRRAARSRPTRRAASATTRSRRRGPPAASSPTRTSAARASTSCPRRRNRGQLRRHRPKLVDKPVVAPGAPPISFGLARRGRWHRRRTDQR